MSQIGLFCFIRRTNLCIPERFQGESWAGWALSGFTLGPGSIDKQVVYLFLSVSRISAENIATMSIAIVLKIVIEALETLIPAL